MKRIYLVCMACLLYCLMMWSGCTYTPSDTISSSSELLSNGSVASFDSTTSFASIGESSEVSSLGPMIPEDQSITKDDGYYRYDSNGSWIGFTLADDLCPSDIPSESYLLEEELQRRVEEYLADKVSLGKYKFWTVKDKPYNSAMVFIYTREVKGYPSFETVNATIAYDGTILRFSILREGIFDSIDESAIPEIDEAKLLEQLDVMVKKKLGDVPYVVKDNSDIVILEDGTLAMRMVVLPNGNEIYNEFFYLPIE